MESTRKDLLDTLERIKSLTVVVVGDLMLDRYIWGKVERISPEAPVPVVLVTKTEDRLGGAGNVCRNLCAIGVKVKVCGLIGDDDEGQSVLTLLEKEGISREGVIIDRSRPTVCKTRVMSQGQQIVRVDRESTTAPGAALREGFAAVVDAHLEEGNAIILSDYGKGAFSEALAKKFEAARKLGRLGLKQRPLVVDPHPSNYANYSLMSMCVAKPNRKEAEAASGILIDSREKALEAARVLQKKWRSEMVLISLGEDGLMISSADSQQAIFRETVARRVFDVSGAGDTVTAIFTAAIACGAPLSVAGDLANIGAGVVVSEIGTVAVSLEKLKIEIERLTTVKS